MRLNGSKNPASLAEFLAVFGQRGEKWACTPWKRVLPWK